jgi:UDP-GlcNAc:undecaprenyl-phosphate GlcNAc-1-phosphate transferase
VPTWALAFSVALLVALAVVARCRRLALSIGFVDVPGGDRKSHAFAVPYLGGIGLILGVLAGLVFEYPIGSKVMLVALAATVLGTIGLVDDDRTVSPLFRFAAEVVAAAIATAAGLRIHATGIEPFDVVLTILWIVGITNALNLLDNMDGLAGGLTAIASTAVFALAVAAGQPVIATLAAATVGACLGFLAFNSPPASIFMGDSGSLFLGFLLAVTTLDVDSALTSPRSFLVPLMVLGIPILDTTMVTIGRLRRQRSVFIGGRDHLSHRLVARGRSPKRAVGVLLGVEALVATLAVLAGRTIMPLSWAVVATVGILGVLTMRTARVPVYLEPVVGLPKKLKLLLVGAAVAVPLVSAPAVLALARSSDPAREGADAAVDALRALQTGDAALTEARFQAARASLAQARRQLSGPLVSSGLAVPGLSSNLRAARTLVDIGYDLSQQGALLARAYTAQSISVRGGGIDLAEVRRLAPLLADAQRVLDRSQDRLADLDTGFILPPLTRAIQDAQARLATQTESSRTAVEMTRVLPAVLGGDGPRRYFLAFQNNAEMRGSGGFLGNWGELVADNGRLRISRFGRLEELIDAVRQPLTLQGMDDFVVRWREFDVPRSWQQVNVSPDFPTTARAIAQLYPQSGGQPVDGVIAIDPFGLASLLELTGPVTVSGWPEPISSENVVDVTLRDAYSTFRQDLRVEFLGDVARQVSESLTSANIGNLTQVGAALTEAVKGEHLKVHLQRPAEQDLIESLGADGALPPIAGDSLMVVDQNMAANKIDYYLKRSLTYDVRLEPESGGREARLTGHVRVALENTAPPTGLPSIVIGPYDPRFRAGENRTYLSVYTPFGLRPSSPRAKVNGEEKPTVTDADAGRRAHSVTVSVDAYQTAAVEMDVSGRLELSHDGWYRLDLPRQPLVQPDFFSATVTVPAGWRVAEVRNATRRGPRAARFEGHVTAPHTMWVRVERAGIRRVLDRLFAAPDR